MATVLTDAMILINGVQIDSQSNMVGIDASAEAPVGTTFGKTTTVRKAGPRDGIMRAGGFVDFDAVYYARPEKSLWPLMGTADNIITVCHAKPTALTDRFYAMQGTVTKWECLGEHGQIGRFALEVAGSRYLIRGHVMHYGLESGSGASANSFNYMAIPSGSELIGVLNVYEWNATSLDVVFQSSASGTGGWSTRLTMTQNTAVGAEIKNWTGATTDTYWRVSWTLVGTSCRFFAGIWGGSRTMGEV